jgi:hypothetical protein
MARGSYRHSGSSPVLSFVRNLSETRDGRPWPIPIGKKHDEVQVLVQVNVSVFDLVYSHGGTLAPRVHAVSVAKSFLRLSVFTSSPLQPSR